MAHLQPMAKTNTATWQRLSAFFAGETSMIFMGKTGNTGVNQSFPVKVFPTKPVHVFMLKKWRCLNP